MAVILAEVVRAGRFVSGMIHSLWLRLTPNPYSTADNYWHKKHDDDGDRDYFSLLVGTSLLTSGVGNGQTPLARLRMTTQ